MYPYAYCNYSMSHWYLFSWDSFLYSFFVELTLDVCSSLSLYTCMNVLLKDGEDLNGHCWCDLMRDLFTTREGALSLSLSALHTPQTSPLFACLVRPRVSANQPSLTPNPHTASVVSPHTHPPSLLPSFHLFFYPFILEAPTLSQLGFPFLWRLLN